MLDKQACHDALYKKVFIPYLQPVFDIRQKQCVGAEILARLPAAHAEILTPDQFLYHLSLKEQR